MSASALIVFVVAAGVVIVAVRFLASSYRRTLAGSDNVKLFQRMMTRQNTSTDMTGELNSMQMGAATRRCTMCRSTDECKEFLGTDKREGFEAFCPNAGMIVARRAQ